MDLLSNKLFYFPLKIKSEGGNGWFKIIYFSVLFKCDITSYTFFNTLQNEIMTLIGEVWGSLNPKN